MHQHKTEVLVVGAGPVGLWTALVLAESGIAVSIVDQEARTAARSYACALHSHTLELLAQFDLTEPVLAQGKCIRKIGFYESHTPQAHLQLSALSGHFPFLVILPQSALEAILEQRLRQAGVSVDWNHRFASFIEEEEDLLNVTVERLGGTGVGYIVPHWEMVVKSRSSVHAHFLIGADGHGSLVRQIAGFDYQRMGDPEFFAAVEFESAEPSEAEEARVALDDTTNVLWPLPNGRYRWTFQVLRHELPAQFPSKERRDVRVSQPNFDERIREYVQKVSQRRAPWFSAKMDAIAWCSEVVFERRVANPFGNNRCWLVGDAAHQTGPVGVQSMNLGFSEAVSLAGLFKQILRADAPLSLLESHNRQQQTQWRVLMGLTGGLKPRGETSPWVRSHCPQLLACLPGTGRDLVELAGQLALDVS